MMTALGINVSSKDTTHGWTGLVSGHKLTSAIYDADQEEKRAWDFYTANVDTWIEARSEAAARGDDFGWLTANNKINHYEEKARLATMRAQMLRKQRYCPHRVIRHTAEEVWCEDCGAELSFHDTSIAEIIDEWQS